MQGPVDGVRGPVRRQNPMMVLREQSRHPMESNLVIQRWWDEAHPHHSALHVARCIVELARNGGW
jgi:hypothetical protein